MFVEIKFSEHLANVLDILSEFWYIRDDTHEYFSDSHYLFSINFLHSAHTRYVPRNIDNVNISIALIIMTDDKSFETL